MATVSEAWYAPRKQRCKVCRLPAESWAEVNAAIWDGMIRRHDYAISGVRAYLAHRPDETMNVKTMVAHVVHIEATWHTGTPTTRERPVFPIDYEAMTDRAAKLSAQAMERIAERVDVMEDKDLIAAAKLGMAATQHRAAMQAKDRRQGDVLDALLMLASGNAPALPEGERGTIIDVTPMELRASLEAERALLEERARSSQ